MALQLHYIKRQGGSIAAIANIAVNFTVIIKLLL